MRLKMTPHLMERMNAVFDAEFDKEFSKEVPIHPELLKTAVRHIAIALTRFGMEAGIAAAQKGLASAEPTEQELHNLFG